MTSSTSAEQLAAIDAQVHVYERSTPTRPWVGVGHGPTEASADTMVAMMDQLGVSESIIVSPVSIYGFDSSYSVQAAQAHPGRFGVVAPVDPTDPGVVGFVGKWAATPFTVGLRVIVVEERVRAHLLVGKAAGFFAALEEHRMPLCLCAPGDFEVPRVLAERHPGVSIVVDHLGLVPTMAPPQVPEPFAALPGLLALTNAPNVYVKATGVPGFSAEEFPFPDIWPPLRRVVDAFGPERVMWGTDWTRTIDFLSYAEGVQVFRGTPHLSQPELQQLMRTTCERFFDLDERVRSAA